MVLNSPFGYFVLFTIFTILLFAQLALLVMSPRGVISWVFSIYTLLLALFCSFMGIGCVILWWLDDGESVRIFGIGFQR